MGFFAGIVFSVQATWEHKKADVVICKKSTWPVPPFKLRNRRRAAWSNKQMSNLVNRVVTRSLAATDATTDQGGACGAKLLIGFNETPLAGRTTASLPVRTQFTSAARTWQARLFLPREGSPAGGWFALEKLGV